MSTDYYTRLEQARGPQPSPQILAALARALRLSDDQRDHLHLLAGHRPPAVRSRDDQVGASLLHLLDRLPGTAAQVLSDLGDVLAQNDLARSLLGGVCTVSEHGRNVVWRWFADPAARDAYPTEEHAHYSRVHVADLRAAVGRRAGTRPRPGWWSGCAAPARSSSPCGSCTRSPSAGDSRMRVLHPVIGPLDLDCQVLLAPEGNQRLVLLTPPPGTDAADRLALLPATGQERLVG